LAPAVFGDILVSGTIYVCSDYVLCGLPEVMPGAENSFEISNIPVREGAHLMFASGAYDWFH
jgi:hypothetical protein